MSQQPQEIRAEEIARVRSYLAAQSARRTPAQLVEALQDAHRQFIAATDAIPAARVRTVPREGEWSAIDVLLHMRNMAAFDASTIPAVIERGEQPPDIQDMIMPAPQEATWTGLLAELEQLRAQLNATVLQVDPQSQQSPERLDITWSHPEFGAMQWREWMLFARVHTLDHARQVQAIGEALTA